MDDTEVRRCMRLVVSQSSKQRRRSEKKNQIEEKFASKSSLSVCDFRIGLKNMLKCERMNECLKRCRINTIDKTCTNLKNKVYLLVRESTMFFKMKIISSSLSEIRTVTSTNVFKDDENV